MTVDVLGTTELTDDDWIGPAELLAVPDETATGEELTALDELADPGVL